MNQPSARPQAPDFFDWAWKHKLMMLPIVLALGLSICSGLIGLTYISLLNGLRDNPLHKQVIALAAENKQVAQALGDPIYGGFITTGAVQVDDENQHGSADVEIPVSGPSGRGRLVVRARLVEGDWVIDHLTAVLDSGQVISIVDENTPAPTPKSTEAGQLIEKNPGSARDVE